MVEGSRAVPAGPQTANYAGAVTGGEAGSAPAPGHRVRRLDNRSADWRSGVMCSESEQARGGVMLMRLGKMAGKVTRNFGSCERFAVINVFHSLAQHNLYLNY